MVPCLAQVAHGNIQLIDIFVSTKDEAPNPPHTKFNALTLTFNLRYLNWRRILTRNPTFAYPHMQ